MAVIGGAYTTKSILASVKQGYFKVLQVRPSPPPLLPIAPNLTSFPPKVTWLSSPIAVLIANKYLDPTVWPIFFNLVSFTVGLTFNVLVKKARLRALAARLRKEKEAAEAGKKA